MLVLGACGNDKKAEVSDLSGDLNIAAAASLRYSFEEELFPMFNEKYPDVKIEATFDSSGKLRTQIESGYDADLFFSASPKHPKLLVEEGLVEEADIKDLLENKIVLIQPASAETFYEKFEDIAQAETVALGDPKSVPVGEYSEMVLKNLGLWDDVSAKTSFGTNVTEVLTWVKEGSADAGIVYSTDAATTEDVKVIAEAPEESLDKKVIYPVATLKESANKEAAAAFLEFLATDEAQAVFVKYGFENVK